MNPETAFPSALRGLPSVRGVDPVQYGLGAWSDHVPFAFDLVTALRPRLLVELGTFSGESYFSFCQAVREARADTRTYAVDTWEGDDHTGALDRSAFPAVDAHNRERYAAFSQLIRGTFDSARSQFHEGTIDLLHIDGFHTYEAVRHDFETWRSAVRPGGIVLFHDTAARHADFGVWRLWEELAREAPGRAFEFRHGYGLGVLRLEGPEPASPFLRALFAADEARAARFREHYEWAADDLRRRKSHPAGDAPPLPPPSDRSGELAVPESRTAVGLQVFFPAPGPYDEVTSYHEGDSLTVQFAPGRWQRVVVPLPEGYAGGPLRLDPVNCFGLVDLAGIRVCSRVLAGPALWVCRTRADLDRLAVRGTARVTAHPRVLSLFSPGLDPVLLLPPLDLRAAGALGEPLQLEVWLRVRATWGDLAGPVSEWQEAHAQRPALTEALAAAHAGLDDALAAQAGELARTRAELADARREAAERSRELAEVSAANERFLAEAAAGREEGRAELEAARTERLLAVTELNVCRQDLDRTRERNEALDGELARETDGRLTAEARAGEEARQREAWESAVTDTRVHARNLNARADALRRQIEAERGAAAAEIDHWREAAAGLERRHAEREAETGRHWLQRQAEAEAQRQQAADEAARQLKAAEAARETERARELAERAATEQEWQRQRRETEEQLATVAGHLADTEAAYRAELGRRRELQASLSWKLGGPWRAARRMFNNGKPDAAE